MLSFGRGSPGRARRMVFGILVLVLVLLDIGFGTQFAVPYPDAVVQGRTLANSSALLVQALASVDKAYGPIQNRIAGGEGQDPDECFFLQDTKGDFEETIYCGGALNYKGCAQGCGGEVDLIFGQHFKVIESRSKWVGMLISHPQTFSYSQVVSGDHLWRPDGVTGSVINHGGGTLEVDVPNTISNKVGLLLVVGGTTVALLVFLLLFLISPKPARYRAPAGLPAAQEAWDNLARLAFTPPLSPPSPVLLGARPGLSWGPQGGPAEAATTSTEEQDADDKALVTVPADPETVPGPEAVPERGTVLEPRALVLGPLGVEGWAEPPARAKTTELAVYLALHSDRAVTAEHLRTVGWPYDPVRGDVALATVHQEVSRVRRCLGAQHLPEARGGYQVVGVTSDWAEFQALVEASRHVDAPESTAYLRRGAFPYTWRTFCRGRREKLRLGFRGDHRGRDGGCHRARSTRNGRALPLGGRAERGRLGSKTGPARLPEGCAAARGPARCARPRKVALASNGPGATSKRCSALKARTAVWARR